MRIELIEIADNGYDRVVLYADNPYDRMMIERWKSGTHKVFVVQAKDEADGRDNTAVTLERQDRE